jgi:hypothetical protein
MKKRVTIGLYVLAVFLSGMVVGAFAQRFYAVKSVYTAPPPRNTPDEWRRKFTDEMRTRLQLDDAQMAQLEGVLDHTRTRFREVREKYKPEMKAIHEEQIQNIRAMLNPAQQAEYAKILEEREQKSKAERKR